MKTYVLDASALLIFLEKKPSGPKVSELLKGALRGHARILMSAVNCGEVYGTILRRQGAEQASVAMNAIQPLPIEVVDATRERCFQAAAAKFRYKLYYADSFAASLALDQKATLVTSDSDFRSMGGSIALFWLKN